MAEFRLAKPAEEAIESILAQSEQEWGSTGRERYEALFVRAILDVAVSPRRGGSIRETGAGTGLRSYHLKHSRKRVPDPPGRVGAPRNVLIYEVAADGITDILGVVHERMLRGQAIAHIKARLGLT